MALESFDIGWRLGLGGEGEIARGVSGTNAVRVIRKGYDFPAFELGKYHDNLKLENTKIRSIHYEYQVIPFDQPKFFCFSSFIFLSDRRMRQRHPQGGRGSHGAVGPHGDDDQGVDDDGAWGTGGRRRPPSHAWRPLQV